MPAGLKESIMLPLVSTRAVIFNPGRTIALNAWKAASAERMVRLDTTIEPTWPRLCSVALQANSSIGG